MKYHQTIGEQQTVILLLSSLVIKLYLGNNMAIMYVNKFIHDKFISIDMFMQKL